MCSSDLGPDASGIWPTLIAESNVPLTGGAWERMYEDPGPVQLPDGTWRVYTGAEDGHGLTWSLSRFSGDEVDGCGGWAAAWVNPTPAGDPGGGVGNGEGGGGGVHPPRQDPKRIPIPPLERPGVPWDNDDTTWMINGVVVL